MRPTPGQDTRRGRARKLRNSEACAGAPPCFNRTFPNGWIRCALNRVEAKSRGRTWGKGWRGPSGLRRSRVTLKRRNRRNTPSIAGSAGLRRCEWRLQTASRRTFAAAVAIMRGCHGRVIVTGMGKSGHVGQKIAATLASTGTPAQFVHPAEASHGDLGMITAKDVVLALSWSGETIELANILTYSRRFRVPLIAMTSRRDSSLGRAADVVLALPQVKEACPHGLAPTTSTLAATRAWRLPRHRASGRARLYGARLQGFSSGRSARRQFEARERGHASRRPAAHLCPRTSR